MRPPRRQALANVRPVANPVVVTTRLSSCDRPHAAAGAPHPTAARIAQTTIEIAARGRGVFSSDFIAAGVTQADFAQHVAEAVRILGARH